jgi:ribosomal protein S21
MYSHSVRGGEFYLQSVTRKDHENFDSLLRRFNRKVQQSGNLPLARKKQFFEKELSKREAREVAIRKQARKDAKNKSLLLKGF